MQGDGLDAESRVGYRERVWMKRAGLDTGRRVGNIQGGRLNRMYEYQSKFEYGVRLDTESRV